MFTKRNDFHNIDSDSLRRPDNYTGKWESHWPNGAIKYRGHFEDGIEVGQFVCYWQDGTVAQVGWRNAAGIPRGTILSFYPDGDKQTEEIWDETDIHPGNFVRRSYDADGAVTGWIKFHEFQVTESWEIPDDEDARELYDSIELDRIVDEAINSVNEDTRAQHRDSHQQGEPDGASG
jgi:hypothetical protein